MPAPSAATPNMNIFELLDEVDRQRDEAIQRLLAQRDELDTKLERLGYEVRPVAQPLVPQAPQATRRRGGVDPNKPCRICGKTGHDGRFHRFEKPAGATPQDPVPV